MSFKDSVTKTGYGFWIFILLLVIVAIGMFFIDIESLTNQAITQYGYVAIILLSFILDFLVQPIGPDVPLVLGIAVLQPYLVLLSVLIGSYITMIAAYLVGKRLGDPALLKLLGQKQYDKMRKNLKYGKWYLAISSLTPVPYIPYLAGMWRLSFGECLVYMVIPRTVRYSIVFAVTLQFF